MNRLIVILFIAPLILVACKTKSREEKMEDTVKAFRAHGYNFTAFRKLAYKKIKFQVPESFENDYGNSYCYKQSAMTRRELQLGIIFTVERFTEDDLGSELMEDFIVEDDLLNAFHDAYVSRRYESLYEGSVSFKKDIKKTVKFKGITQTIGGKYSEYTDEYLYYCMATIKVKEEYYIFQLIAPREMMDYVYDDFERILETVRPL